MKIAAFNSFQVRVCDAVRAAGYCSIGQFNCELCVREGGCFVWPPPGSIAEAKRRVYRSHRVLAALNSKRKEVNQC